MRRIVSLVLVGLGTALLVVAALVHFYAYPSLARVPADSDHTTQLEAKGATVFNSDPSVLAPETTDLSITNRTVADGAAIEKAPDGTAVWVSVSTIKKGDGSVFQQSTERIAFGDVSGAAVTYDGSFEEAADGTRVPIRPKGQIYKFPFNSQKKTYLSWDSTLGKATPAVYTGTSKVDGVDVYTYHQVVDPTTVGQQEVPGSLLGSDEASVDADLVYSVDRTFYIDPITGAPVNRIDKQRQELQYDGQSMTVFDGTVTYTPDQIKSTAKDIAAKAPLLDGMRFTYPLVFGLLGLLALVGGLLLRRRDPETDTPVAQERELVTA